MHKFLTKITKGSYSLAFLNNAQFLGALNDNIFKLVVVFLLIQKEGGSQASSILSLVGALFVAPFLLFSSTAGVLADRFSKQKLLMIMKVAEMGLMALAIVAFSYQSIWGSYALLFILATHSALFGPSKYGIIAELVPSEKISSANGLVTSFTYLAIILGTFLASFLTDISNRNFSLIAIFCFCIATLGFLSTLCIKKTEPQQPNKKLNPFFIREIYFTLKMTKAIQHLLTAIFGSAFFLFIGAFVQLNIIPYALEHLHLNEIAGGYLFLATALGIACGSVIAGKISKNQIELGLSCIAGIGLSICLLFLGLFAHHLTFVISLLFLLGLFGGTFLVPFDAFIQTFSPHEKRGQIIGALNFLSFLGVLLASFSIYVFSHFLESTAAQGFTIIGAVTLFGTLIFIARLSDLAFAYMVRLFIQPFFSLQVKGISASPPSSSLFILIEATPLKALLLLSIAPHTHFIIPQSSRRAFPWFKHFFYSLHPISKEDGIPSTRKEGVNYCLYLNKKEIPKIENIILIELVKIKKRNWKIIYTV